MTAIEKANKAKQALRIISRFFSPQELLSCQLHCFTTDFIMEQRFGFLLPCLQLFKKYSSRTSLKMLKICQKDWQGQFSFQMLHKISQRATIEMWSNYSAACGMYNVITTSVPC